MVIIIIIIMLCIVMLSLNIVLCLTITVKSEFKTYKIFCEFCVIITNCSRIDH
jgi:hypothetical protein